MEGRLYASVYSVNETTKRILINCGMGGKLKFEFNLSTAVHTECGSRRTLLFLKIGHIFSYVT